MQYLAESGQAAKAIALLERTRPATIPDALIALGNAYTSSRAASATRSARSRGSSRSIRTTRSRYQNLGIAQLQAKDLPGAEASLRRAVQLDPSLAGAYTALGVAASPRPAAGPTRSTPGKRGAALGDPNAADNLRAIR